jgi:hypothetical protein
VDSSDWRDEPLDVVEAYARLCQERHREDVNVDACPPRPRDANDRRLTKAEITTLAPAPIGYAGRGDPVSRGAATMDNKVSFGQETFPCPLDPQDAVAALAAHFNEADLGLIHYLLSQIDAVERESGRLRRRLKGKGEDTLGDETIFDAEA